MSGQVGPPPPSRRHRWLALPRTLPGSSLPGPAQLPVPLRAPCAATLAAGPKHRRDWPLSRPSAWRATHLSPDRSHLQCPVFLPASPTLLINRPPRDTWKQLTSLPLKHKTGSSPMGQPVPHSTGLHSRARETQGSREGSISAKPQPGGIATCIHSPRDSSSADFAEASWKPIWALRQRKRKETRTASGLVLG